MTTSTPEDDLLINLRALALVEPNCKLCLTDEFIGLDHPSSYQWVTRTFITGDSRKKTIEKLKKIVDYCVDFSQGHIDFLQIVLPSALLTDLSRAIHSKPASRRDSVVARTENGPVVHTRPSAAFTNTFSAASSSLPNNLGPGMSVDSQHLEMRTRLGQVDPYSNLRYEESARSCPPLTDTEPFSLQSSSFAVMSCVSTSSASPLSTRHELDRSYSPSNNSSSTTTTTNSSSSTSSSSSSNSNTSDDNISNNIYNRMISGNNIISDGLNVGVKGLSTNSAPSTIDNSNANVTGFTKMLLSDGLWLSPAVLSHSSLLKCKDRYIRLQTLSVAMREALRGIHNLEKTYQPSVASQINVRSKKLEQQFETNCIILDSYHCLLLLQ